MLLFQPWRSYKYQMEILIRGFDFFVIPIQVHWKALVEVMKYESEEKITVTMNFKKLPAKTFTDAFILFQKLYFIYFTFLIYLYLFLLL